MSGFDVQEVKRRVTLRALLERDGIALKKSGATLVCYCPFHQEKTPSCRVHEKKDGDWFKCFGCGAGGTIIEYWALSRGLNAKTDFPRIIEDLARIAGMTAGAPTPAPLPARTVVEDEPVIAPALNADELLQWERANGEIFTDREEIDRIAEWRGYRPAIVEWAARKGLIGSLVNRGGWREAFLISRPLRTVTAEAETWSLESVGWHVRLAPQSRGNESDKASWRYEPRTGLGAWPFVVLPAGGIAAAKYIFCLEGQWDALALVDLMGWEANWPKEVAVFGMRGSTSAAKVLEYPLRRDAAVFLIADADEAGEGWFVRGSSFPAWLKAKKKRTAFEDEVVKILNEGSDLPWRRAVYDVWFRYFQGFGYGAEWLAKFAGVYGEWRAIVAERPPAFSEELNRRVRAVYGFWPSTVTGKKDLNDVLKVLTPAGREVMRAQLRGKILPRRSRPQRGPTFWVWLKKQRKREDLVGSFAKASAAWEDAPHGRVRESAWKRYLRNAGFGNSMAEAFDAAWKEWTQEALQE